MRRKDREVTDAAAVLAIIEAADSCCLGMIDETGDEPRPYVVALNFGFEPPKDASSKGTFWFHAAREGHKLDVIRLNPSVCVHLDCDHEPVTNALGCDWGMKYASVFARGCAAIVEDPAERRRGIESLMQHYSRLWGTPHDAVEIPVPALGYDETIVARTTVIRVDLETVSAKRKA